MDESRLPDHAQLLLDEIRGLVKYWNEAPESELDVHNPVLGRLNGLAASLVALFDGAEVLLDCAGCEISDLVDALYELNENHDISALIKTDFSPTGRP